MPEPASISGGVTVLPPIDRGDGSEIRIVVRRTDYEIILCRSGAPANTITRKAPILSSGSSTRNRIPVILAVSAIMSVAAFISQGLWANAHESERASLSSGFTKVQIPADARVVPTAVEAPVSDEPKRPPPGNRADSETTAVTSSAGQPAELATSEPMLSDAQYSSISRAEAIKQTIRSGHVEQWQEGRLRGYALSTPVAKSSSSAHQECKSITTWEVGAGQGEAVTRLECKDL